VNAFAFVSLTLWFRHKIRMGQKSQNSQIILDVAFALLAVGAVTIVSVLGHIATQPNLSPWFAGLSKPSFYPPNWVFGPVWTALYLLMAFALWRILRLRRSKMRTVALFLLFLQLALNAAWSWMFFWAHSPLLGLINIVPQVLIIVATIIFFARLDRLAGWCLAPLLAWITFASVLNFSIWWLNG
jgi:benzodiazapine receptor